MRCKTIESRNRPVMLSMYRSGFGFGRSCVFCMGPRESKQTSLNLLKKPRCGSSGTGTAPLDPGHQSQVHPLPLLHYPWLPGNCLGYKEAQSLLLVLIYWSIPTTLLQTPHERRRSAPSQASKCSMMEKTMGFKVTGCYHWTWSTGQMFSGHEAKKHSNCLKQNIFHWLQKFLRLQGHTQACPTFYIGAKDRFSGLQNKLLPHWVISPGFNLIVYQKVTLIFFLASWPVDSRESSVSIPTAIGL